MLLGAGGGDVQQALIFEGAAGFLLILDQLYQRPVVLVFGGAQRRQQHLLAAAGGGERQPVEQRAVVAGGAPVQAGQHHQIPFQALGAVHGEDLELDVVARWVALGVLVLQQFDEVVPVIQQAIGGGLVQRLQIGGGILDAGGRMLAAGRPAEALPGAFHQIAQRAAAPLGAGVGEGGEHPLRAAARFAAEPVERARVEQRTAVSGERVQVGQGQAADGGAQDGECCGGVRRVQDGAGEGQQILHRRTAGERVELHRPVGHLAALQRRQDVLQVAARPDDDGGLEPWLVGVDGNRPGDQLGQGLGFGAVVGVRQDLDLAAGATARLGWRVGDGAGRDVLGAREDGAELVVHPVDDLRPGAEVARQPLRLQRQLAHASIATANEQTDVCLTEAVDGLHGIAHQKQAAAIVRAPSAGELFQQVQLTPVGVLVLVHQDVADAVVEVQAEIGVAAVFIAEAAQRGGGQAAEVAVAAAGEHQLQLGGRALQHPYQGVEHVPLVVAVARLGQVAGFVQGGGQGLVVRQAVEHAYETLLLRNLGWKAGADVHALARLALLGEQRLGQPRPALQGLGGAVGQRVRIGVAADGGNAAVGGERAGGKAQQLEQFFMAELADAKGLIQCLGGALELVADDFLEHGFEALAAQLAGNPERPLPLLAPGQEAGQQVFDVLAAVVAPVEQARQIRRQLVTAVRQRQHVARRLAIQRLGVVRWRRHRAQGACHRHGAGQVVIEAVDGADQQPLRVFPQAPFRHLRLYCPGAGERILLVSGGGFEGRVEIPQDAVLHLRRRLAGEGDGEDLLGGLRHRQQAQVALHQQRGFSGAGRCLDDHRTLRLYGGVAGFVISHAGGRSRRAPRPHRRPPARRRPVRHTARAPECGTAPADGRRCTPRACADRPRHGRR